MAEETTQMGQATHCTGDCRKCFPMQRAYCSSQIAYNNMRMLETLSQSLAALSSEVKDLDKKVDTITNSEGLLFNPSTDAENNASVPTPLGI